MSRIVDLMQWNKNLIHKKMKFFYNSSISYFWLIDYYKKANIECDWFFNFRLIFGLLILLQKCKSEKIVHLGKWDFDYLMNIFLTTLNKAFSLNSIEMSNPLVEHRYISWFRRNVKVIICIVVHPPKSLPSKVVSLKTRSNTQIDPLNNNIYIIVCIYLFGYVHNILKSV
jgi:hypothetical protein